jgi:fructose-1,6-bisphosphatase/inositol monophosphatase family enzyme
LNLKGLAIRPQRLRQRNSEFESDLSQILADTCRRAAIAVRAHYLEAPAPSEITVQGAIQKDIEDPRTLVTPADRRSDEIITSALQSQLGCTILSEESGTIQATRKTHFRAIVDPLDGTLNFNKGCWGLYGISIGIESHGRLVAGAIALPSFNKLIVAETRKGVRLYFLEGTKPPTKLALFEKAGLGKTSLRSARICIGRGAAPPKKLEMPPLSYLISNANEALNFGSCTVGLASVLLNKADALILPDQYYWDFAGGLCALEQLGGHIAIWRDNWLRPVDPSALADASETSQFDVAFTRERGLMREITDVINGISRDTKQASIPQDASSVRELT